jgi:hypothetical protein
MGSLEYVRGALMKTAVAFIIFRRPELTRRVFAAIRQARPPKLFLIADGPRVDRSGEAELCLEARLIVEKGVDWPCELVKIYSDVNMGCGRRVSSGLNSVFEQEAEAIILEDDCVPDLTFFPFCEELLDRYRDDDRVGLIAGCNFQSAGCMRGEGASYYFSRYLHCWGWASWRRVWVANDHELYAWRNGAAARWLSNTTWSRAEKRWWRHALHATSQGRIDTWDFPFVLPLMMAGRFGIVAQPNLVTNIGIGPDATHTQAQTAWASRPSHRMIWPLKHPSQMVADREADGFTSLQQYTRGNLWWRAIRFVWRHVRQVFMTK